MDDLSALSNLELDVRIAKALDRKHCCSYTNLLRETLSQEWCEFVRLRQNEEGWHCLVFMSNRTNAYALTDQMGRAIAEACLEAWEALKGGGDGDH